MYEGSRDRILASIRGELMNPQAASMSQLPEDMESYMNYIYAYLSESSVGIIQRERIDQSSAEYAAWREGTISLRDFIYSGIAGNWVDTTKLNVGSKYSDADDIFAQLVDQVLESLQSDRKFTKRMFRYLVNDGVVTGRQLCLALFAQNVLEQDEEQLSLIHI